MTANAAYLTPECRSSGGCRVKLLKHPQEYGVVSSAFLPYVLILPVFASLRAQAKKLPPTHQFDAWRKLRHWYWASVFTNRYSGSVESMSARDFLDVKAWFDDDAAEPPLIAEFARRVRNKVIHSTLVN